MSQTVNLIVFLTFTNESRGKISFNEYSLFEKGESLQQCKTQEDNKMDAIIKHGFINLLNILN